MVLTPLLLPDPSGAIPLLMQEFRCALWQSNLGQHLSDSFLARSERGELGWRSSPNSGPLPPPPKGPRAVPAWLLSFRVWPMPRRYLAHAENHLGTRTCTSSKLSLSLASACIDILRHQFLTWRLGTNKEPRRGHTVARGFSGSVSVVIGERLSVRDVVASGASDDRHRREPRGLILVGYDGRRTRLTVRAAAFARISAVNEGHAQGMALR